MTANRQYKVQINAMDSEYFAIQSHANYDNYLLLINGYERGWNERNKKVIELQARIDAITVGFFPTQDQLREWEQRWQSEINALRARNDTLYTELTNERMLRYAETERCAKVAREYGLSPVVGKAIAALILRRGE